MTEQTEAQSTETQTDAKAEKPDVTVTLSGPDAADNVRETPAFRGVLKQLEDERKAREKHEREVAKLKAEKEARELAKTEEAGEYEKAKAALEQRALEAERRAQEIELRFAVAAEGVNAPKAQKFLISEFQASGAEDFGAWIAEARTNEEYTPFFSTSPSAPRGVPAPRAQSASTSGNNTDWAQVKANLGDPKTAAEADLKIRQYVADHGTLPPGIGSV